MKLKRIDPYRIDIEPFGGMRVPGRIFADEPMLEIIRRDESLTQVANVAHLPGIIGRSLAMPDIHWGYGFPIGGVAAMDMKDGVISPGGVGYDINCGCRLLTTSLTAAEIRPRLKDLIDRLYLDVPTGVGKKGPIKLSRKELDAVLTRGAAWAIRQGYGQEGDLEHTEDQGVMAEADPAALSDRAIERGQPQLGTLGSGNHFLEIGQVKEIFEPATARAFGLFRDQVTVMIHSGSRGLGYQVCDDFLQIMTKAMNEAEIQVPDRQLACAPISSPAGRAYFGAMAAAANYAWTNRQIIMHFTRESLYKTLSAGPKSLHLDLLYDVAHNIAKKERHLVDGREKTVCVHRKGATRAFPAGHPDTPEDYRSVGQPVLIPGDMGRASYVLVGAPGAMAESFGSCCHGAGRLLSRHAALKKAKGRTIYQELEDQGIIVRTAGRQTLAEEMPEAYKDVTSVVDIVHNAGLARKVARIKPLGVIKG
ncbi:MAG: RtcB family protein [Deltaproteobacteria bacterium]|nr:RtcB family protein [Deltaproteobacteria bacterium]